MPRQGAPRPGRHRRQPAPSPRAASSWSGVLIQVLAMVPVSLIEGHRGAGPRRRLRHHAGRGARRRVRRRARGGGPLAERQRGLPAARPPVRMGAEGVWVQFVPLVIGLVLAVIAGLTSDALRRRTEDALGLGGGPRARDPPHAGRGGGGAARHPGARPPRRAHRTAQSQAVQRPLRHIPRPGASQRRGARRAVRGLRQLQGHQR